VQSVRGLAPDVWPRAATGDPSALTEVRDRLRHEMERITGNNISGSAQDISRGRVTEIDFLNGYLEQKSRELGLQAETNRAVAALVRQIERQELTQSRDLLMQ
jgi:2-dehydropantoate 2-reductase